MYPSYETPALESSRGHMGEEVDCKTNAVSESQTLALECRISVEDDCFRMRKAVEGAKAWQHFQQLPRSNMAQ